MGLRPIRLRGWQPQGCGTEREREGKQLFREGEEGAMTEQGTEYRAELLHENDYRTAKWSGGLTTELAIAPEGSAYADRDFLWRLSSATVDAEESLFTSLPDYDRIIMTLKGEIRLSHNGGAWIGLSEYEPHAFDGGDETRSVGRVKDFNLMLRKGRCRGRVEVIRLEEQNGREKRRPWAEPGADTVFFYCAEGRAGIRAAGGPGTGRESLSGQQKKRGMEAAEEACREDGRVLADGGRAAEAVQLWLEEGDSLRLEKRQKNCGDADRAEGLPDREPFAAAFPGMELELEGSGVLIAASVFVMQDGGRAQR